MSHTLYFVFAGCLTTLSLPFLNTNSKLNAFSVVAAPTLWNKLPSHIRNSKSLNVFKKHSYSNKSLIVNVLIIFSDFVKHFFLYCTGPQHSVTWFWCFINIHYYYYYYYTGYDRS